MKKLHYKILFSVTIIKFEDIFITDICGDVTGAFILPHFCFTSCQGLKLKKGYLQMPSQAVNSLFLL